MKGRRFIFPKVENRTASSSLGRHGDLRQLSVVLKLIVQCGELRDDALAFLCLLIIRHIAHSPVEIINGTSLSKSAIELRHIVYPKAPTTMTGHR